MYIDRHIRTHTLLCLPMYICTQLMKSLYGQYSRFPTVKHYGTHSRQCSLATFEQGTRAQNNWLPVTTTSVLQTDAIPGSAPSQNFTRLYEYVSRVPQLLPSPTYTPSPWIWKTSDGFGGRQFKGVKMKVSRHPPHVLSSAKAAYFMGYRFLSGRGWRYKTGCAFCISHHITWRSYIWTRYVENKPVVRRRNKFSGCRASWTPKPDLESLPSTSPSHIFTLYF
jgi:hypothetical protein